MISRCILSMIFFTVMLNKSAAQDQPMPRKAFLGISYSRLPTVDSPGAIIRSVREESKAYAAGLRTGQYITALNNMAFKNETHFRQMIRSLKGNQQISFTIQEAAIERRIIFTPDDYPKEIIPGADVMYSSVKNNKGQSVHVIITRPHNVPGKLPVLFFVPWLSCSGIEKTPVDGAFLSLEVFQKLAQETGFATVRVEKPGLNGSEGGPCEDADYETELSAYKAALQTLKKWEFMDPAAVYLYGESLGGFTSALLAQEFPAKGLIAFGSFGNTWFDHMLEIEENRFRLMGKSDEQVKQLMQQTKKFYTEYLIQNKKPSQILTGSKYDADIWPDEPEHQYGRPLSFYQQVQKKSEQFPFTKIHLPSIIITGENDWIMGVKGSKAIAEALLKNNPGTTTHVLVPSMHHNQYLYDSPQNAFNETGHKNEGGIFMLVKEWLQQQQKKR